MTNLETRLAEAREWLVIPGNASQGVQQNAFDVHTRRLLQKLATDAAFLGFDNCAAIAREVVAEKDAEIAKLKARIQKLEIDLGCEEAFETSLRDEIRRLKAEPRKVSDAQRRLELRTFAALNNVPQERVDEFCDLVQAKAAADAEATT